MPDTVSYSLFPAPEPLLRRQPSTVRSRSRTPSSGVTRRSASSRATSRSTTRSVERLPADAVTVEGTKATESQASDRTALEATKISEPAQPLRGLRQTTEPYPISSPVLHSLPTPLVKSDVSSSTDSTTKRSTSSTRKAPPHGPLPALPPIAAQPLKRKDSSCSINSIIVDSPTDPELPKVASSSACSSSAASIVVSSATGNTAVSLSTAKMTPPLQTAPTFGTADTYLTTSPALSITSSTSPVTYPSIPKRLSSPVSASPPQRSLTRSSARTNTSHRTRPSDATSTTLVGDSVRFMNGQNVPLQESLGLGTGALTTPLQGSQACSPPNAREFQSIFPAYDPDLPLSRQNYHPTCKPIVSNTAGMMADPSQTTPPDRTANTSCTLRQAATTKLQEVPVFPPPPQRPIKGSVKRTDKNQKDTAKPHRQRSNSSGAERQTQTRTKLVKKSRSRNNISASSVVSSAKTNSSDIKATISAPIMVSSLERPKRVNQDNDITTSTQDATEYQAPFSLTPATDPKTVSYEPSNAGSWSLVQAKQHCPVPSTRNLQPLPEGHEYAEQQKLVVHGVTVALGALAFVAGVGVEVGAGVLGKVGKKV